MSRVKKALPLRHRRRFQDELRSFQEKSEIVSPSVKNADDGGSGGLGRRRKRRYYVLEGALDIGAKTIERPNVFIMYDEKSVCISSAQLHDRR